MSSRIRANPATCPTFQICAEYQPVQSVNLCVRALHACALFWAGALAVLRPKIYNHALGATIPSRPKPALDLEVLVENCREVALAKVGNDYDDLLAGVFGSSGNLGGRPHGCAAGDACQDALIGAEDRKSVV